MEKMIKVINDNLRNVMNGIKEHKKSLEDRLEHIKDEMTLKVNDANSYKKEVENARNIISTLEEEITDLENDLHELNEKFGSRDFKEILAAGNKEINSKIIEKRAAISEQNKIILDLTDKARILKDKLIELKSQKEIEDINLEKTKILEGYFCSRITEIINYSEEHPNELESLQIQVPQEKLDIDDSYESDDINTIIDGSIFEEIDEIQTKEPDEELIQSVLDNPEDVEIEEPILSKNEQTEISTTDQLENMIKEAKDFVEKNKAIHGDVVLSQEENKEDESDDYIDINVPDEELVKDAIDFESTGTIGSVIIKSNTVSNDETDEQAMEVSQPEELVDTVPNELFFEEENDKIEEDEEQKSTNEENDVIEDDGVNKSVSFEPIFESVDDDLIDEDVIDLKLDDENDVNSSTEEEVIDLHIEDDNLPIIEQSNDFVIDSKAFEEHDEDMNKDLTDMGLDINSFEQDDLILLSTSYEKENIKDFIETMKEHNLSLDNIYKNIRVLVYVTSQNLRRILDLLEKTDAKNEDINTIFKYLDKVNISKLEQVIMSGSNVSMTYALSEAIAYNKDEVIGDILGFDRKEKEILKKNATKDDYKLMNVLPDIVKANYDELNKYHVNNAVECITKYPHKFTLTNSVFHQMLDKYDTDDLVRCINKNAAVIEKL